MNTEIKIDAKLNNVLFKCYICAGIFNNAHDKAIGIAVLSGIIPNPNGQNQIQVVGACICEKCFKNKKYNMSEPLNFVIPKPGTINIKK